MRTDEIAIPQSMLNVVQVAAKKDHREELLGVHFAVRETMDGPRAILEATDGKVAIAARWAAGRGTSLPESADLVLSRASVEAALALDCKIPKGGSDGEPMEEGAAIYPDGMIVVSADHSSDQVRKRNLAINAAAGHSDPEKRKAALARARRISTRKSTFVSPVNGDSMTCEPVEVRYPDLSAIIRDDLRFGEMFICLDIDPLKKMVAALAKIGAYRVVMGIVQANPASPIYLSAQTGDGIEITGVLMPVRLGDGQKAAEIAKRHGSRFLFEPEAEADPLPVSCPAGQVDIADEATIAEMNAEPRAAEDDVMESVRQFQEVLKRDCASVTFAVRKPGQTMEQAIANGVTIKGNDAAEDDVDDFPGFGDDETVGVISESGAFEPKPEVAE